ASIQQTGNDVTFKMPDGETKFNFDGTIVFSGNGAYQIQNGDEITGVIEKNGENEFSITEYNDGKATEKTKWKKEGNKETIEYYEDQDGDGQIVQSELVESVDTIDEGEGWYTKNERDKDGKVEDSYTYDDQDRVRRRNYNVDEPSSKYSITYDEKGNIKSIILADGTTHPLRANNGKLLEIDPVTACPLNDQKCKDAVNHANAWNKGLPNNWFGDAMDPLLDIANFYNQYILRTYQATRAGNWVWGILGGDPNHHMFPDFEEDLDRAIIGGDYQAENHCRNHFQDIRASPAIGGGEYAGGQVRWYDKHGNDIMSFIITGERSSMIEYPNATTGEIIQEFFYRMEWKVVAVDGDLTYNVMLKGAHPDTLSDKVVKYPAFNEPIKLAAGKTDRFIGATAHPAFSEMKWNEFCLVFTQSSSEFRQMLGGFGKPETNTICTPFYQSDAGLEAYDFGSSNPGWMALIPNAEGDDPPKSEEEEDGYNPPGENDPEEGDPDYTGWADSP
ncbi:MAG: hypothetical protein ACTSWQ_02895, partial [Candidatus Thorarchaeota archaeon]